MTHTHLKIIASLLLLLLGCAPSLQAKLIKVLGIAYGQNDNKEESLKYLKKAKELGDPQVDEWIGKLQ